MTVALLLSLSKLFIYTGTTNNIVLNNHDYFDVHNSNFPLFIRVIHWFAKSVVLLLTNGGVRAERIRCRCRLGIQCLVVTVMITSPLLGYCLLPNYSVFNGLPQNKIYGRFLWNQQCFLTIGQGFTPYVGFWNSVVFFQHSIHPFQTMETR